VDKCPTHRHGILQEVNLLITGSGSRSLNADKTTIKQAPKWCCVARRSSNLRSQSKHQTFRLHHSKHVQSFNPPQTNNLICTNKGTRLSWGGCKTTIPVPWTPGATTSSEGSHPDGTTMKTNTQSKNLHVTSADHRKR